MMKYLCLDYGAKRIGIAVSSEGLAFPRDVFPNDANIFATLGEVIAKEKIESIIVGDTLSHGGAPNPVTTEADTFVEELKRATGIPVARASEVFSSIEASRYAEKGNEHNDASAAAIILQRFLDMRRP